MKKLLSLVVVLVLMLGIATTVNAAASDDLLKFLSGSFTVAGKTMSLTSAQKTQVERYLDQNPVDDAQAQTVKNKVNEMVTYVNKTGVTDLSKLTEAQKTELTTMANSAASTIGLTLTYNATDKSIGVYKNGTLVDTVTNVDKLVQTGGNSVAIVGTVLAIIAIAAFVGIRKYSK